MVFDGAVRISQFAKNEPEAIVGRRIIRFECNGLLAVPGRLAQMVLFHEHVGKVVVGLGKLGIQSDGLFVVVAGLSKVAQGPIADPGVVVRLCVVRRPSQRQVVVTDGILVPILVCQQHPKLVAGLHLVRIQHQGLLKIAIGLFVLSDGLLAIGQGAIELGAVDVHLQSRPAHFNSFFRASLSLQRDCQAIVGLRIVCPYGDGPLVCLHRQIGLAMGFQQHAQCVEELRIRTVGIDGLSEPLDGLPRLGTLVTDHAQIVQYLDVARVMDEDPLVEFFGTLGTPRLVVVHGRFYHGVNDGHQVLTFPARRMRRVNVVVQLVTHPFDDRGPPLVFLLAKQAHRWIPGTVRAIEQPTPFRLVT